MLTLKDARKVMLNAIKNKIPIMLWGAPGIGKSEITDQLANSLNYNIVDLRLAQLDPTDIRGLPNLAGDRVKWLPPSFLPECGKDGKGADGPGILFLDELDKAPPSVQNAALQLVLDRCVGDYELPSDWAIVCAGNREEDQSFSVTMSKALANRMIHVYVQHDLDCWATWARENKIEEDIIAFLHFKPELLYKVTGDHAFPSPRSWTMASKLIDSVDDEVTRKRLIEASVGEGAMVEFHGWSMVYKQVDPLKILQGEIPEFDKSDVSFVYAMTMAVAFYARKKGAAKYADGINKFLKVIAPEMRVVFFRQQSEKALIEFAKNDSYKDIISDIMGAFEV